MHRQRISEGTWTRWIRRGTINYHTLAKNLTSWFETRMANARRISVGLQPQPVSETPPPPPPPLSSPSPSPAAAAVYSVAVFLKRPSAFPLLLSVFVLLTWVFLRLEHPASAGLRSSLSSGLSSSSSRSGTGPVDGADSDANLVRFSAVEFPSKIARDWRGWLMDPVTDAREARLRG